MKPLGGSNLIKALKKAMNIKNLDCICIILGSVYGSYYCKLIYY